MFRVGGHKAGVRVRLARIGIRSRGQDRLKGMLVEYIVGRRFRPVGMELGRLNCVVRVVIDVRRQLLERCVGDASGEKQCCDDDAGGHDQPDA